MSRLYVGRLLDDQRPLPHVSLEELETARIQLLHERMTLEHRLKIFGICLIGGIVVMTIAAALWIR